MKTKRIFSLMGATLLALGPTVLAAGHGGGGGFGGGGFAGGGHFGGGGGFGGGRPGGGAFHSSARGFGGGRPAYFYSRGMHFAQPSTGQFRSAGHMVRSSGRTNRGITNSPTHSAQPSQRATLNGRTDHISERHSAANWHSDWDRRHSHFFHNRFFVFDDGFWFGLDPGFFPWDYYPYYAYDYYPYDYYPGYYADVEPYYYNEGVYSDTPAADPNVTAVQNGLAKLGYYHEPVDGLYGRATRDAVAHYQNDHHLAITGTLTTQTLQSLGVAPSVAS